jgi:hypothetical protein
MRTFVFCLLLLIFNQPVYATKIVGNGGDRRAIEFVDIGTTVLDTLAKSPIQGINVDLLNQALFNTIVESTDEALSLNGVPKDAINYPYEKRIIFNRLAWDRQSNYLLRATFALHEYLGIMRVDDVNYQVTRSLLRGLWFVNGTDAETMIDVLQENQFAVNKAVRGVTRMTDASEISCERNARGASTDYTCMLQGKGSRGQLLKLVLEGRKAREVWTLVAAFRNPSCVSDSCQLEIHEIACQGENTRMDKPAFCTAKQ